MRGVGAGSRWLYVADECRNLWMPLCWRVIIKKHKGILEVCLMAGRGGVF